MSFRTKLLSGIIALVVFSVALFLGLTYFHAREVMFRQIQATALSLATAAVSMVDSELHEQVQTAGDEALPAYKEIESKLRRFRDDARREDVHVAFVYTMRQTGGGNWIYVVDAEEDGEDKSLIGDAVDYEELGEVSSLDSALEKGRADEAFTEDEFGVWLSANVPIRDQSGKPVALLGVDLAASDVRRELGLLLTRALIAVGVTLCAGLALALVLAQKATRPLLILKEGVDRITAGELNTRIDFDSNDEFGSLANSVNAMAESIREREMLKEAFARYVSRDISGRAFDAGEVAVRDGKRQRVTVLFSDIRNFGEWSEASGAEDVITQLDEYFSKMVEIIFRHRGTLDKSVGDGLMAVFGTPRPDPEQERNAVNTMLDMHAAVRELEARWVAEGKTPLRVGIGVYTGIAAVGNTGAGPGIDYSAVGGNVNVAAKLESETEAKETSGLVASETVAAVRDDFEFERVGEMDVEGLDAPVELFTLPDLRDVADDEFDR